MEHAPYLTVTPALCTVLSNYTLRGGALLVSGSYLGEESSFHAPSQFLLRDVLHAENDGYITDWSEQGVSGLGITLDLPRWLNPEQYAVTRPEILCPTDGAFSPFAYEHSCHSAAVAYRGDYRSVVLGFPFEAIRSKADRHLVMSSLLDFLTGRQ